MDDRNPTRKDNGVTVTGKATLVLQYDCVTYQVGIAGDVMPLSLAQMICGEAARVLDEQRRIAAAQQLRQQIAEQDIAQRIAASVRGGSF